MSTWLEIKVCAQYTSETLESVISTGDLAELARKDISGDETGKSMDRSEWLGLIKGARIEPPCAKLWSYNLCGNIIMADKNNNEENNNNNNEEKKEENGGRNA